MLLIIAWFSLESTVLSEKYNYYVLDLYWILCCLHVRMHNTGTSKEVKEIFQYATA
jgi:hypothetical protein